MVRGLKIVVVAAAKNDAHNLLLKSENKLTLSKARTCSNRLSFIKFNNRWQNQ
jgi:hypothetical protein